MTALQLLGAAMLAAPFVGIYVMTGRMMGWREATLVMGSSFALAGFIYVGAYLLKGGY